MVRTAIKLGQNTAALAHHHIGGERYNVVCVGALVYIDCDVNVNAHTHNSSTGSESVM